MATKPKKRVLNVGGNNRSIPLPSEYAEFEQILLDIDPTGDPDIVCDARDLFHLKKNQFDAIYCSHNLEHYYAHDVPKVLAGFLHLLKKGGLVQIRVPDMLEIFRVTLEKNLDLEDILYESPSGPISVLDVLYGFQSKIKKSGNEYFAHKTGFTRKSLAKALVNSGFTTTFSSTKNLEIKTLAFKGIPDPSWKSVFNLALE